MPGLGFSVMIAPLATRTDFTLEAERLLRDPSQFKWYAVTLLVIVFLAYGNDVQAPGAEQRRAAGRALPSAVQGDP